MMASHSIQKNVIKIKAKFQNLVDNQAKDYQLDENRGVNVFNKNYHGLIKVKIGIEENLPEELLPEGSCIKHNYHLYNVGGHNYFAPGRHGLCVKIVVDKDNYQCSCINISSRSLQGGPVRDKSIYDYALLVFKNDFEKNFFITNFEKIAEEKGRIKDISAKLLSLTNIPGDIKSIIQDERIRFESRRLILNQQIGLRIKILAGMCAKNSKLIHCRDPEFLSYKEKLNITDHSFSPSELLEVVSKSSKLSFVQESLASCNTKLNRLRELNDLTLECTYNLTKAIALNNTSSLSLNGGDKLLSNSSICSTLWHNSTEAMNMTMDMLGHEITSGVISLYYINPEYIIMLIMLLAITLGPAILKCLLFGRNVIFMNLKLVNNIVSKLKQSNKKKTIHNLKYKNVKSRKSFKRHRNKNQYFKIYS